mgnify:FL=1|tara:strand:+ start:186 stop:689 length:504 start_codon:yes stop_codon:yes gene_type:complete
MNSNDKKPTLENLFQSKKYDIPSEKFWNDLQDQVKGRALASLARPSFSSKCVKSSVFILPVILAFVLFSKIVSSDNSEIVISSEIKSTTEEQIDFSFDKESLAIIQNLEESEFDLEIPNNSLVISSVVDKDSFVEHSLQLDIESAFEVEYLSNIEYDQDDLFARYTF